jgi:hypothetical protein
MNDLGNYFRFIRIISLKASLCIFASLVINAQGYDITKYYEELNLKFNSADEKKFEKAIKQLDDADITLNEANQMYSLLDEAEKNLAMSSDYKKAFKTLIQASEGYKDGHTLIYQVFKDKAREFWDKMDKSNHYAAGMEKAKYYERKALRGLSRALIKRDIAAEADRYESAVFQMTEAFELEKLAIRDQGRAVQIYQDFPVEYNYGWEDDVTLEEVLAMNRDPVIKEPPQDIYGTVDKDTEIDSSLFAEIIFKVQIAAHTVPLSEEYLRTIYLGGMQIDMIYEEEWYKYSIGRYKTLEEATKTLEECNVKKAFIVPYQAGKKLTIQEAMERMALKEKYMNSEGDSDPK